jgi:hypothetical protein
MITDEFIDNCVFDSRCLFLQEPSVLIYQTRGRAYESGEMVLNRGASSAETIKPSDYIKSEYITPLIVIYFLLRNA